MSFVLTADAAEFRDRAWTFLESRIEYNVLATVLMDVFDGHHGGVRSLFGYSLDPGGAVSAAALRTPPFPLLVSELEAGTAEGLINAWLEHDPGLTGVNGIPATAREVAAAWQARTGGHTRCVREMAMHTLERVSDPLHPPAGRLRLAHRSERELLTEWWQAFAIEADLKTDPRAAEAVAARLENGALFVWEDRGPVSLIALSPMVAGVVRIGPVYTPPQWRRRGYAGMAVAEVSRSALAEGARASMLFTDLANPTSNKIYAEVGYRRVADWEEHAFEATRPDRTSAPQSSDGRRAQ